MIGDVFIEGREHLVIVVIEVFGGDVGKFGIDRDSGNLVPMDFAFEFKAVEDELVHDGFVHDANAQLSVALLGEFVDVLQSEPEIFF